MSHSKIPQIPKTVYNQTLTGHFGKFGTGDNAQIFFVQTGLQPKQLDKVSLVSDIRGSEKWQVRDLFQREVDDDRVTESILPYFQDPNRLKFFNPLTLTFLPIDEEFPHSANSDLKVLKEHNITEGDTTWTVLEDEGKFRFKWLPDTGRYCQLEWNDTNVKLVAIDGQHRLSALKRFYDDPEMSQVKSDFLSWTIPVVIFGVMAIDSSKNLNTILDSVRKIFVYINTTAKSVNSTRQILLSDESITRICTQELLQQSHANDCEDDDAKKNNNLLPLLFFDWRGVEKRGRRVPSEASVKDIEEIHNWLQVYIIGEDFSAKQETAFSIDDPSHPLNSAFKKRALTQAESELVRKVFGETVLLGLSHLLNNFTPYRNYVKALRALEKDKLQKSDHARHAFAELRFGVHHGSKLHFKAIRDEKEEIIYDILDIKAEHIGGLVELDIGMRGVVYAFGKLKAHYESWSKSSVTWLDYSKWFTETLNRVYDDGWFNELNTEKKKLRRHITHSLTGSVRNYRLEDARKALGALLLTLVAGYSFKSPSSYPSEQQWIPFRTDLLDGTISSTLYAEYRKEARAELKDKLEYMTDPKKLTTDSNAIAQERTADHIASLIDLLEKI
ncbi:MAG: hypothetical protein HN445_00875 [Bacteroidetes Order II. Incertae sedis bacterium]|jgi:hypothetical protein|nr:hypothetical protein [Bacteroidetes Order II. bacterium]